ncbi:MAG: hypothetical protein CR981_01400 [Proteobacteria bacterium]|nr:MAG: hypothetical protein CR981_01400 [Pseudomonadota bacterium]PIE64235.1 MAG: hypothetical protein CSA26_09150 [Desulfobacterales bacterium]
MKTTSLLFLLILLPQVLPALTLEQIQQKALAARPVIRQYQVAVEQSGEDLRLARSGYYPSVNLGYKAWGLDEATSREARENSSFYGALRWNLFSGLKDQYSIVAAEMINEVEELRLESIKQDIQLAIALKYLAVYNQAALLDVAEDTSKTLKKLYLESRNRQEVGLLDKNTVLKFKVDYDNADLEVRREKANLQKAINDLSREANLPLVFSDLEFEEFDQVPGLFDPDSAEQKMLADRSDLRILEKMVAAAQAKSKVRKAGYYPQLNFSTTYSAYDNHYLSGQGRVNEDELRAELSLSVNLFNGYADEAAISKAEAEVRSVNFQLAELQNNYKTELKNLFVDYEINRANIAITREDIAYAEENLRITEIKYKEGLQRQLDLLAAIANLTRAQANYVSVIRLVFTNYFQIIRMVEDVPQTEQQE